MSRRPKPTKLKVFEGNPGKRRLNAQEPMPAPVAPECPDWLDEYAKEEWARLSPELERLGLLTIVDQTALASYCSCYAAWRRNTEAVAKTGTFYKAGDLLRISPAITVAAKALRELRAWGIELGLTPASRSRIATPSVPDDEDEFFSALRPTLRQVRP